jgi:hypothetical protein
MGVPILLLGVLLDYGYPIEEKDNDDGVSAADVTTDTTHIERISIAVYPGFVGRCRSCGTA